MPRPTLILDLDATLICSVSVDDLQKHTARLKAYAKEAGPFYKHVRMRNQYEVIGRPGLDEFLEFAFTHFNVVIFTMASLPYAWWVITTFILNKDCAARRRHIIAVLTEPQCAKSQEYAKERTSPKHLSWLFDQHPELHCDPKRTFFLDDLECVRKKNPKQALFVPAFNVLKGGSGHDKFLWQIQAELIKRLRT